MTKNKKHWRIDEKPSGGSSITTASTGSSAPPPIDSSPTNSGTSYPYEPAGSGDCIMLTCFDESGLKPTIWYDNAGSTFNAKYDELVQQITPATADLIYVVDNELSRMPSVRTLVLWVNWFTRIGASENKNQVRPGIGYNFKARLVSTGDWNVSGYTPSTAINFPATPAISGTIDDAAFVAGARYLASRGYRIGIAPIVRFVDTSGTEETTWETWRGDMTWPDLTTLNNWLSEYQSFVLHYLNLLLSSGLTPALFYVGSEFRDLSTTSPTAQQAAWITALQSLSSSIKAASPTTLTTYAANYDEYSYVGSDFHLDALWSYPDLDRVGIDWYQPLTLVHTNDPNEIRKGLLSGENFDWYATGYVSAQNNVSTSDGSGASDLTQNAMDAAYASKNVSLFISGAHYVTKPGGVNAASSPLAGDWRGSATVLSDMSGPATTAKLSTLPSAGDGMRVAPHQRDTWLTLNGTSDYGAVTFPTYSTAPTSYTVEVDFRYTTSGSFPRLVRSSGVLDAFVDTGGSPVLKFAVTRSGGTDYSSGIAVTSGSDYLVSITVSGTSALVYSNGVLVETMTLGGAAVMPASAGTWYLGAYDTSNNFLGSRLYKVRIQGDKAGIKSYGGVLWFEESYSGGCRTAWTPGGRPFMCTEVGIASMQFSTVRPNTFPAFITGTGHLPDSYPLKAYFEALRPEGLSVQDIIIPYGGTGIPDQVHQAVALDVLIKGLRNLGASSQVVYNMDTRPWQAQTATYNSGGTDYLYYTDGPKRILNHELQGKLIGGYTASS